MWQILVPTVRPNTNGTKFFTTRYHRVWDDKVRSITNGLTICYPTKGQWVSPNGIVFKERMIPVLMIATDHEMESIAKMTSEYYSQEVVLYWMVSNKVIMYTSDHIKNTS